MNSLLDPSQLAAQAATRERHTLPTISSLLSADLAEEAGLREPIKTPLFSPSVTVDDLHHAWRVLLIKATEFVGVDDESLGHAESLAETCLEAYADEGDQAIAIRLAAAAGVIIRKAK